MGERSPDSQVEIGLRQDGIHVIRLHRNGGIIDIQLGSQNPEPFKETEPGALIPQSSGLGQEIVSSQPRIHPAQENGEIIPRS